MHLTITSVAEKLYDGEAHSVNCPGSAGEFTVLSNHAPFISTLKQGEIRVRKERDSKFETFEVQKGVIEVSGNNATILI